MFVNVSFLSFQLNFITDIVGEGDSSSCEICVIDICLGNKDVDSDYSDTVPILSEGASKLLVLLNSPKVSVDMFDICFAPSKCEMNKPQNPILFLEERSQAKQNGFVI